MKIAANDLRKGNLINTEYGILTVHAIVFNDVQVKGKDGRILWANQVEGVEITEDLLKEFGWGKGEFDSEYLDNVSLKQEVLGYNVNSNMFCIETNCDVMEINHIKYAHEIQNTYYWLTKKELTKIKL